MKKPDDIENIVFDLGAGRKGTLNENILHVFAAWINIFYLKCTRSAYSRSSSREQN